MMTPSILPLGARMGAALSAIWYSAPEREISAV